MVIKKFMKYEYFSKLKKFTEKSGTQSFTFYANLFNDWL